MSLLHDQELADTREAERLRRELALDQRLLERAAAAAIAASAAARPVPQRTPLSVRRALVEEAAARLATAVECDVTPAALQAEQLAGVLRTLRDRGVFGHRQLEAGS